MPFGGHVEGGSTEFAGNGMLVLQSGLVVHFRPGATKGMGITLTGTDGRLVCEIRRDGEPSWHLFQDTPVPGDAAAPKVMTKMPWPGPQFMMPGLAVYALDDAIACLEGRLDEPKNSGRRVAMALEVEIALSASANAGGQRVELPVADRTSFQTYDWFR